MSQILFGLVLVFALVRAVYHISWASLTSSQRLAFWVTVAGIALVPWIFVPFTRTGALIWGICSIIGWFIPEIFSTTMAILRELFGRASHVPPLRLLLWIAVVLTIACALVNQDTIGYLGTLWGMVFALWLIVTRGFSLGSKPAKKPAKRRRR
jgi:hypothetical protein